MSLDNTWYAYLGTDLDFRTYIFILIMFDDTAQLDFAVA